jgi:hypothetical protein
MQITSRLCICDAVKNQRVTVRLTRFFVNRSFLTSLKLLLCKVQFAFIEPNSSIYHYSVPETTFLNVLSETVVILLHTMVHSLAPKISGSLCVSHGSVKLCDYLKCFFNHPRVAFFRDIAL